MDLLSRMPLTEEDPLQKMRAMLLINHMAGLDIRYGQGEDRDLFGHQLLEQPLGVWPGPGNSIGMKSVFYSDRRPHINFWSVSMAAICMVHLRFSLPSSCL